jgi:hypothetical protein
MVALTSGSPEFANRKKQIIPVRIGACLEDF